MRMNEKREQTERETLEQKHRQADKMNIKH